MRLLDRVPESHMVAAFLKAEYSSERFADDLKRAMHTCHIEDATLITEPHLDDTWENQQRAAILGCYRGYGQNREMFADVPEQMTWYRAELTPDDVARLRYVDYSYWNELTNHTHLVKDAISNIQRGNMVYDVSNDRFWAVAKSIEQHGYTFEPLILTAEDEQAPLTVLEGHLRATGIGLAGQRAPAVIPAIVGYATTAESSVQE